MNEASASVARALHLPAGAYGSASHPALDAARQLLQPARGLPGSPLPEPVLALGADPVIDVNAGPWRALVARRHSGARLWEAGLEGNLVFVLSDLDTGRVRAGGSFTPDKRMKAPAASRSGPPPSDFDRRSTLHALETVAVPPLFGADWPAGRWALTLLYFDWRSNTVEATRQPAPPKQVAAFRAPTRGLEPATPAAAGSGLTLQVPASARTGQALPLALALSAEKSALPTLPAGRAGTGDTGQVVVASLVLVRLDETRPRVLTVALPSREREGRVEAEARFDAAALGGEAWAPGDYRVYATSGRIMAGPWRVQITP